MADRFYEIAAAAEAAMIKAGMTPDAELWDQVESAARMGLITGRGKSLGKKMLQAYLRLETYKRENLLDGVLQTLDSSSSASPLPKDDGAFGEPADDLEVKGSVRPTSRKRGSKAS